MRVSVGFVDPQGYVHVGGDTAPSDNVARAAFAFLQQYGTSAHEVVATRGGSIIVLADAGDDAAATSIAKQYGVQLLSGTSQEGAHTITFTANAAAIMAKLAPGAKQNVLVPEASVGSTDRDAWTDDQGILHIRDMVNNEVVSEKLYRNGVEIKSSGLVGVGFIDSTGFVHVGSSEFVNLYDWDGDSGDAVLDAALLSAREHHSAAMEADAIKAKLAQKGLSASDRRKWTTYLHETEASLRNKW